MRELKGPRKQEQNGETMLGFFKAHVHVQLNFRLRIRPRVLCGISEVDLSTTILGEKVTLPIVIAPTATQKLAHPDGKQATAKGNINMQATYSLAGGPFYISLGCRKMKPSFFWGGAGAVVFTKVLYRELDEHSIGWTAV